jgi:hypothetical protein
MELLGELKHSTSQAIVSGRLTSSVSELLSEAHNLALRDVVSRLSIAADSPQAKLIQKAVTEQQVALQRAAEMAPDGLHSVERGVEIGVRSIG